jgi:hypothetical protein
MKISRNLSRAIAMLAALTLVGAARGAAGDHYGLAADNKIVAQGLVNEIMAAHPGLVAAGMHCVPPGGHAQVIIASTLDVIGKPSDPEDILRGTTVISPSRKAPKLGIMLPLHDKNGQEIGSLALQFRYSPGEDQVKYFAEATAIRESVAQKIPDLDSLFSPSP